MQHAALEHASAGGEVLAYTLGARGLVCLRSQLPLIRGNAPTEWVHVAYEGEWRGYHGRTFEFTRQRFHEAIANHERQRNAAKLDFDHETDFAEPGTSVPARGWVHRLEIRDADGVAHLWALVEFGAEAVEKNRAGGYRFCSGVFDFEATDRVTGEPVGLYMPRLSLTDDPFIDGQTPIILSRAAAVALSGDTSMSKIKKADFLSRLRKIEGDEITPDQIAKLAQSMALLDEAMAGGESEAPVEEAEMAADAEEPAPMSATPPAALAADAPAEPVVAAEAPAPEADPAAAEASSLLEQAMAATGMDLAALIEALKAMVPGDASAAVAPLSARINEQTLLLSANKATIAALSNRAETAEAEVKRYREAEADAAVGVLIESGRILDNGRDDMRALFLSNRKAFDTLSAALPAHVPVGEHAAGQTPPTAETPAIDESDPFVKERRRILSGTWLGKRGKDAVDTAIRKELADRESRKNNGVRV